MNRNFILLSLFLSLIACQESSTTTSLLPSSTGHVDDMILVMDQKQWDDTLGATFRKYMGRDFMVLPQSEPVFNIKHRTFKQFNNKLLRKFNLIVIAGCFEEPTPESDFIKEAGGIYFDDNSFYALADNTWAEPQMVMYLYDKTSDALVTKFTEGYGKLKSTIYGFEDRLIRKRIYRVGKNKKAGSLLEKKFGIVMQIPSDYKVALEENATVWLRKETAHLSSSILITHRTIDEKTDVDYATALGLRDMLGKKYISSENEGSYMTTDTLIPVLQKDTLFNSMRAIETRGLWKIVKDFMGGPFLNYLLVDESSGKVIMLDGFVHAPKLKKREHIRQLETIFKTIEVK